ncbi:MAG: hypothetical protein JWP57_4449, partial [Spirosoma sp.]|nr:hypothetical protein [Spirosoma sp.]
AGWQSAPDERVEVGGTELDAVVFGLKQNVRQNRQRVAG